MITCNTENEFNLLQHFLITCCYIFACGILYQLLFVLYKRISRLFQQWKFALHSFYLHKLYLIILDFIIHYPKNYLNCMLHWNTICIKIKFVFYRKLFRKVCVWHLWGWNSYEIKIKCVKSTRLETNLRGWTQTPRI
jgi:hypothetical protein